MSSKQNCITSTQRKFRFNVRVCIGANFSRINIGTIDVICFGVRAIITPLWSCLQPFFFLSSVW